MNQVANVLKDCGVKKGDRVGIYLNRSIETAIAIYGILNAGAVYVPLDPKAPATRSRFLINDCGIKVLITNPSQKRNLKKVLAEDIELQTIIGLKDDGERPIISWEKVYQASENYTRPFALVEYDLAYILYTSGSTGDPKGIMHTHASGLSYARLSADLYQLTEADRIGNHAPIYFDISTIGFFAAPLVGASTVIAQDAHIVLPTSLSQLLEKEKVTVWYSVPLALIQMLEKGLLEERNMESLRLVIYAGEAFPPKYLRRLMQQWPHAQFSNSYGPTETNQCTYYNLTGLPMSDDPIPIGRVLENMEGLILNEDDDEVSLGEVGELLIRGVTTMKGYWQNPSLTAKSFFSKKRDTGLADVYYRTGDLVRMDAAGDLHLIGRKDHQVKIRGYRVELGEVEAHLVSHPEVSEAAVFTSRADDTMLQIEAAIIPRGSDGINEEELRTFLKEKIPQYAIPELMTFVTSFPRTATGKIKRSALKEQLKLKES